MNTKLLSLLPLSAVLTLLGVAHMDSAQDVVVELQDAAAPCDQGAALIDFVGMADVCEGCGVPDPRVVLGDFSGLILSPVPGAAARGEGLWRVQGTPEALASMVDSLSQDPRVEVAECEIRYQALGELARTVPNDPLFGRQWNMEMVGAPEAWSISLRWGAGAVAAVVDTGVSQVPDLDPDRILMGQTFGSGKPQGRDDHGHGTHVAGTVAQSTDNKEGVAGLAGNAKILPFKVLGPDGSGTNSNIASAVYESIERGANVINMSLGGSMSSAVLRKAVMEARDAGVVIVAAAGNDNGPVNYPGADPGVVAVGAVGPGGKRSPYSSHGKQLDIAAPGGDTRNFGEAGGILQNTILRGDDTQSAYLAWQGTSMATPHVTGAVALLAAAGVTRPSEVEEILAKTAAVPKPEDAREKARPSDFYGAGVLRVQDALAAAHTWYKWERALVLAALAALLVSLGWSGLKLRRRHVHTMAVDASTAGTLAVGMAGAMGRAPLDTLGELLGIGAAGNPVLWSAFVAVVAYLALPQLWAGGVALGLAAWLLHGAVVLPCVLRELPGGLQMDQAWLALHGLLAFGLAFGLLRRHFISK